VLVSIRCVGEYNICVGVSITCVLVSMTYVGDNSMCW
jgi:hypothetical protein